MMVFEEYDQIQIKEARRLLWNVYEANYGDPSLKKAQDRLFARPTSSTEGLSLNRLFLSAGNMAFAIPGTGSRTTANTGISCATVMQHGRAYDGLR